MFKVLGSVLFLFCLSAHAIDLGKNLPPKMDSTSKPSFNIYYVYDADRAWSFLFSADLTNDEIRRLPPNLFWTIADAKTGSAYQAWSPMLRSDLILLSYETKSISALFKLLPNIKQSVVLISADQKTPMFYIDLKTLCETYPNNVRDLSNTSNPTCIVESYQLPDLETECKNETEYIQDLFKRGLLSCTVANKQLAKKGCAPLNCR